MLLFNNSPIFASQKLYPPLPFQSTILLIIAIFSVPCFIFVLYYSFKIRPIYRALGNHVIILLLIYNGIQTVTDVPVQLATFYTGIVWPPTTQYCIFYYFVDYYLFTSCFLLLTWGSFERHILIFHAKLYDTSCKRFFGHYVPLCFCCVYPFVYYTIFLLFYPCENSYDLSAAYCAPACYLSSSKAMVLYEQIAHGFALIFLTCIFNALLLLRIVRQKNRCGRPLAAYTNRKMATQLFGICFLFLSTNGGFFIIQLGQLIWEPEFGNDAADWIYPLSMCMPPIMSFLCLSSWKEINKKLKCIRICHRYRRRRVIPLSNKVRKVRTIAIIESQNI